MPSPVPCPAWSALRAHHEKFADFSLRKELASPTRFDQFHHMCDGVLFDFSKHLIDASTLPLFVQLAREMGFEEKRAMLFTGGKINVSEKRPALHTALRAPRDATIMVEGENVIPFVHSVLDHMEKFVEAVRSGVHRGFSGKAITDVVNIGIGGSDLGPRFVTYALQNFAGNLRVHFVSNVDGADLSSKLAVLDPATTLFIVASKTFTTEETMLNAQAAKDWFLAAAPLEAIAQHFVALSTNEAGVTAFGIAKDNMFPFRDWVGGRYSLWSAIGLSIALAVGFQNFRKLLDGAAAMDAHFRNAPLEQNIPFIMGTLGIWYRNFWDYPAHMLLPYDNRLGKIAKFIQQMDMESNGKSVDRDGNNVTYATAPVIFGEPGTDSQHSFMQLVHQTPLPIPADFIICKKPAHTLPLNHLSLMANFLAQTRALAIGQTLEEAGGDPSRVFSGNRPSTSIILPELTPYYLGMLIAAYEHKIFVQGVLWNLNSFDQPGVELGKKLAKPLRTLLEKGQNDPQLDCSTHALIDFIYKRP
ncbi:MAG: glucose-6-phosphate isomerase [Pseudobdellovibrionaceae bacterium]